MSTTFSRHYSEHVDGTKARWRPALTTGTLGADGNPESWVEVVIFSCPSCGAPQGVGGDLVKIQPNGTTDAPVKCYHCGWTDVCFFERFDDPKTRGFEKLKADAADDVKKARATKI